MLSCGRNAWGGASHAVGHLFGTRFCRTTSSLYECWHSASAATPFCFTVWHIICSWGRLSSTSRQSASDALVLFLAASRESPTPAGRAPNSVALSRTDCTLRDCRRLYADEITKRSVSIAALRLPAILQNWGLMQRSLNRLGRPPRRSCSARQPWRVWDCPTTSGLVWPDQAKETSQHKFFINAPLYQSMSTDGSGPWPCTACRSDINTGDKFCITCGKAYNDLKCQGCDALLTIGFDCTQCGQSLDWDLFFGVKNGAGRPGSSGSPNSPRGRPPPAPVSRKDAWWMSLTRFGKFFYTMVIWIVLSIVVTIIGAVTDIPAIWMLGGLGLALGLLILLPVMYLVGRWKQAQGQ